MMDSQEESPDSKPDQQVLERVLRLPLDLAYLHADLVRRLINWGRRRIRRKAYGCIFCSDPANMGREYRTVFHGMKYRNHFMLRAICPCARRADEAHPDGPYCTLEHQEHRSFVNLPILVLLLSVGWSLAAGGAYLVLQGGPQTAGPATPNPVQDPAPNTARAAAQAREALAEARKWIRRDNPAKARVYLLNARQSDPDNPEIHLELARCALKLKEVAGGIQFFRRALDLNPAYWIARVELVEALVAAGQPGQAATVLDAAPDAAPPPALDTRLNLSRILLLLHAGDTDRATKFISELAAQTDLEPDTLHQLAGLSLQTGTAQQAEALYRRLIAADTEDIRGHLGLCATLRLQGWKKEAAAALKDAAALDPEAPGLKMHQAELFLMDGGDVLRGLELYRDLLRDQPDNLRVKARLATLLLDHAQHDEALTLAEELSANRVNAEGSALGHFIQAELYRRKDFHSKAVRHAQQAVEATPGNARYHFLLGQSYQGVKKWTEAAAALDRAIALEPSFIEARINLSRTQHALGQEAQALKTLDAARHLDEGNRVLLLELGNLHYSGGRLDEARPYFEQVLEQDPENLIALNNLAFIFADLARELDRAESIAAKLRERMPGDPNVADLSGWILVQRGEQEEGMKLLQFAARHITNNPYMHYHLGVAWLKQGEKKRARLEFEKALALGGRFAGTETVQNHLNSLKAP